MTTQNIIIEQLFKCAASTSKSEDKRANLLHLPEMVINLGKSIYSQHYDPQGFTVFAVTDPKLREIFAPAFVDRLAQQWLVQQTESWFDKRLIDDSFANRKGKGTLAAVKRLRQFMRKPDCNWYCKLDIRAFFPSIHRPSMLALWKKSLAKAPFDPELCAQLNHVASAILMQSPLIPPPKISGNRSLLASIPPHKSQFHAASDYGLPIGSLSSQFFANIYLNELDQFVKHVLKVRMYLRYMDDFVLLGSNQADLIVYRDQISKFLEEKLHLKLHPHKTVIQRCNQGIDFLGSIVYPQHQLVRQRIVHSLRARITRFNLLLFSDGNSKIPPPSLRCRALKDLEQTHLITPKTPSLATLRRVLSTINSYYGLFCHANTYRLRKHIYHHELGSLKQFFLPNGPSYEYLKLKKIWQILGSPASTISHKNRGRIHDKKDKFGPE